MSQLTKVQRDLGAAFDADKHCPYTGWALVLVPARYCCGRLFFWRVREKDGTNSSTRDFTPEEEAWAAANKENFEADLVRWGQWHKQTAQKLKYK